MRCHLTSSLSWLLSDVCRVIPFAGQDDLKGWFVLQGTLRFRSEDCGGSSLSFLEYMLSLTQAIDSSHEERERWSRLQRHLAWEVISRAVASDLGRWLPWEGFRQMEGEKFYETGEGVAYWLLMYPLDSYGGAMRMLCDGRGPWYVWRDINSLLRTRGRGGCSNFRKFN